ncbi:MAG: ATP-binding protein [Xanthomonadales bacterium]|nr:ATP-binding protein [Xanthomonadales bacterium]
MNSAAEDCLAIGRERGCGNRLEDIEGIPDSLIQAISTSSGDQRGRHVRECELAGGWFDCTIHPVSEDHLLLEFHDLKWKMQQNKLQQRELQTGMMDLLRRNLSHEIRNPLGGIRGAAQMMAAELDDHELGALAKLIMREVDRIDELIARFGQTELQRGSVDVHYVIQETTQLLQLESFDGVKIIADYDPSIPAIRADAAALRQLLLNLLRNAYQAGANEIVIRSRVDLDGAMLKPGSGSVVRLDIEDNGCGVPESLRSMLFLPLVTGRRDGTGLGLALAQQIAAAHEGLLSYAPLDPGSRFTLRIPLEKVDG